MSVLGYKGRLYLSLLQIIIFINFNMIYKIRSLHFKVDTQMLKDEADQSVKNNKIIIVWASLIPQVSILAWE